MIPAIRWSSGFRWSPGIRWSPAIRWSQLFYDPSYSMIPSYLMIPSYSMIPAIRWSSGSMEFDNPKVHSNTSITDGLVFLKTPCMNTYLTEWRRWSIFILASWCQCRSVHTLMYHSFNFNQFLGSWKKVDYCEWGPHSSSVLNLIKLNKLTKLMKIIKMITAAMKYYQRHNGLQSSLNINII